MSEVSAWGQEFQNHLPMHCYVKEHQWEGNERHQVMYIEPLF